MSLIAWFDEKIAACEKRATEVEDELKFVYLDAAHDNREARAAVAELIEKADNAARILHNAIEAGQLGKGYATNLDDLRAALARVGAA